MRTPVLAALLFAAAPAAAATPANPWHAEARAILEHMVSVRTVEKTGNTPKLQAWLRDRFVAAGVPASAITLVPIDDTQAMVVRIAGRSKAKKPILFSAHMDVVDADPKDWTRDPFKLVEENGYFFGRGVLDDKNSATQEAVTILRLAKERKTPARDLIFVFIGDEESTMATTSALAGPKKALIDAEYAINLDGNNGLLDAAGKPVIYSISAAEKTYADFALTVTNPGGHSSRPQPSNAIYELADALKAVQGHQFPIASNAVTRSEFGAVGKVTPGPLGDAMRAFAANPVDGPPARLIAADPAWVGVIRTTCVATMLRGGHAPNALPQSATAHINCRIFPGTSPGAVKATLQGLVGNKVGIKQVFDIGRESPVSPPRAEVEAAITKAVYSYAPGVPIGYAQESGASDGREYRTAGIPTYGSSGVFLRNEDDFMHGLNERIPVKSFYDSVDYLWTLVSELADPR